MNSLSLSCHNGDHTLYTVLYTALMHADFTKALGFHLEASDTALPCSVEPYLLCKMKGKGCFGLGPEANGKKGTERCGSSKTHSFALSYFPKPEEALCARMRLDAVMESQGPRYADTVRSFHKHDDFASRFRVGTISLHYEQEPEGKQTVFLTFEAETAQRILAPEGVGDATSGWAVVAGDFEEDLPALELCRPFFHCLAAAMSQYIGDAPRLFMRGALPSLLRHRLADGSLIFPSDADEKACARASEGEENGENGRVLDVLAWGAGAVASLWPEATMGQAHVQTRFVREEGEAIDSSLADSTSILPEDSKTAAYWLSHHSDALHAMAQISASQPCAGQAVTVCTALLGEDFAGRVGNQPEDKDGLFILLLDPEQSGMRICQSEEARDSVRRADAMVCLYDAAKHEDKSFEGHSVAMTALSATLRALNPKAPVYTISLQDFAIQDLMDKMNQDI